MFCTTCGYQQAEGAAYCGRCGARSAGAQATAADVPWTSYDRDFRTRHAARGETAGFASRLLAWIIDQILSSILAIVAGIAVAIVLAVLVALSQSDPATVAEQAEQDDAIETGLIIGFYLGYFPVWFIYYWVSNAVGGGWGKRMLGIRIVSVETGLAPGAGKGFLRTFIGFFSSILYLGYLWSLWDSEKRTWHDHASGTTVVLKL